VIVGRTRSGPTAESAVAAGPLIRPGARYPSCPGLRSPETVSPYV